VIGKRNESKTNGGIHLDQDIQIAVGTLVATCAGPEDRQVPDVVTAGKSRLFSRQEPEDSVPVLIRPFPRIHEGG
jgi:hypothetical protein